MAIEEKIERLILKQEELSIALAKDRRESDAVVRSLIATTAETQQQLSVLIQETRGLMTLYRDIEGIGRLGAKAQTFLLWVAKWPVIGGGCYVFFKFILDWAQASPFR